MVKDISWRSCVIASSLMSLSAVRASEAMFGLRQGLEDQERQHMGLQMDWLIRILRSKDKEKFLGCWSWCIWCA